MRDTLSTRLLGPADEPAVRDWLAVDPVASCLVATRVERAGLDPRRLGAELWGHGGPELDGLCLSGPTLVPLTDDADAVAAFAGQALRQGRRCSSIVGPQPAVEALWGQLIEHWGPAREERPDQPLMALRGSPRVAPDDAVRVVRPAELDVLLPACVAMFTEEIGLSPLGADGGRGYRARISELIATGRAFARIEGGEVVFKAELGALSAAVAQIQGVWVAPHRRGEGLAAAGVAAVATLAVPRCAPLVSLYVNRHNEAALRAYRRVGFEQVGTFMTVLF